MLSRHSLSIDQTRSQPLALALARLSTLQGHPRSWQHFAKLGQTLDVVALAAVPLPSRLAALWCSEFPRAAMSAPAWPAGPEDLPALWLGPRSEPGIEPLLLVHGTMPNGALCCLDELGQSLVLPASMACQGRLLTLRPDPPARPDAAA